MCCHRRFGRNCGQHTLIPQGGIIYRVLRERSLVLLLVSFWAPEKHDVRLRPMNCVVNPSTRLLHTHSPPLVLGQKLSFRQHSSNLLWQYHMPIFIDVIIVFLRILKMRWHFKFNSAVQRTSVSAKGQAQSARRDRFSPERLA